jgi:hypothetical protein
MSLHGRASKEQPGSRWVPPFENKKVMSRQGPVIIRAAGGTACARAVSMTCARSWRLCYASSAFAGSDGPPFRHMFSSRHWHGRQALQQLQSEAWRGRSGRKGPSRGPGANVGECLGDGRVGRARAVAQTPFQLSSAFLLLPPIVPLCVGFDGGRI